MSNVRHPTCYEKSDADPRLVTGLALGIAAFLLVTPFLLAAGYPDATRRADVPRHLPEPAAPRLQIHPRTDLDRLRSYEREQLESFGWIDRARELAHIPIDQAMQILVDRGLPGWPSPTAAAPNNPAPQ